MITLTYGTTTLTLPVDYQWIDEHDWCPVEQAVSRTLTGALIVDIGGMTAGKPITLQPEAADCSWMPLSMLNTLRSWAAVPGREMALTIRGATHTVLFRHQDGAIEASPVVHYNSHDDTDFWLVTLRFMEI